jgi:hypothetical protein
MSNKDFTATISVDRTPEEAFNAINHVGGWWSENIEGSADKLGAENKGEMRWQQARKERRNTGKGISR